MPVTEIPLGEWMPDRPNSKNPGCEVADNVLPTPGGYGPILGPSYTGLNISFTVRGAKQFFTSDGGSILAVGTADTLYIKRADFIETSGYTSIGLNEAWDFCQFNDFLIATGQNNAPQYISDIDTDDTWEALPGSPPNALRCAKVNEFLMLGNVDGVPHRIQWSAYNDPTGDWTPSRLTQAGFADLDPNLGPVQRIVGGRYGMVFQKRGVSRIEYVGPPQTWRTTPISVERGALSPYSVISLGYITYFLAQDGFYVTDGASIQPIGRNRINRWFFDHLDQSRVAEVQAAVDWQNKAIFWLFYSEASAQYDRAIIYSWEQERWSSMTLSVSWMVGDTSPGVSIDALDAEFGNLDAIPGSLDSAEFKAGDRVLSIFASEGLVYRYYEMNGDALEATWETGEVQPSPNQRVFAHEATPVMDSVEWDAQFAVVTVDNQGNRSQGNLIGCGWNGFAPIRAEGQKMALRMVKPSGAWSEAQSIHVRFEPAGYR